MGCADPRLYQLWIFALRRLAQDSAPTAAFWRFLPFARYE
jgi:hypothetical protein